MATWAKIKFFYDIMLGTAGSSLTATSTASGDYSVNYLYNMLETNMWKAANTNTPMYIAYDAGAGNAKTADYMVILGHNLKTIGASIVLQYSTTGAWAGEEIGVFAGFSPDADTVILKEWAALATARYWRLKITGVLSAPPYMTLLIWGLKTELDYATASFDPYEQEAKANINLSQGGYVTGVHTQYAERSLQLRFDDADATLYGKIKTWWDTSGLKNFFVAWETANNPNDIWLMRPDTKFSNPLMNGGLYRSISVNLKGRKE